MNSKAVLQKPFVFYTLLLVSTLAYYILAYQTARENFAQVLACFSVLFIAYYLLFKFFAATHFIYLVIAAFLFRLLLLWYIPNLSDDVYRFLWDGRLAANGINPFLQLPAEIIAGQPIPGITQHLFEKLNSPSYYAIYPPVLQSIFCVSAKLFPGNIFYAIIFLKAIIVVAEAGSFFLIIKILKKLSMPVHLSLIYVLNPLVIIELTGNVHFEAVLIFFVLLSFLLFLYNKWIVAAIWLAAGIATKLIPVIFIPLFISKLGWKKGLLYAIICGSISIVLFAIVFDRVTLQHMLHSVDLFFRNFEFNASLYYIVRWVGEQIKGYNIIAQAGPLLSILSITIISFISFYKNKQNQQQLFNKALFIITAWYLFATTVHPWYICLPLVISVFTSFRFAMLWSFTAVLSYAAYQTNPAQENLWLIGTGYMVMLGFACWEVKKKSITPSYTGC